MHGKRRNFGLGGTSLVSLAEAQDKTRDGGDPDTLCRRESLTFWQVAETVHAQLLPTRKNAKHTETWLQTMRTHVKPRFGDRPIETLPEGAFPLGLRAYRG